MAYFEMDIISLFKIFLIFKILNPSNDCGFLFYLPGLNTNVNVYSKSAQRD